jgi:putative transcriptional regulator
MSEVKEYLDGKRSLHVRTYDVPERINVRAIRERVGMSQAQFAIRFAISPRTLQEWEQGRRMPDATVRAYLTVIDRNPDAVQNALLNK